MIDEKWMIDEEMIGYDAGRRKPEQRKPEQETGEKSINEPEPLTLSSPLSIIQSPLPDLRFTHRHLRWEASTATYTPDQTTRRGSGARRRTGGTKAAEEVFSHKTSP